jgi:hypothetical protein
MNMSKPTKEEILNNLAHFHGTDGYARYMGNLLLTDGVQYMAEACGAFWLVDILYSVQTKAEIKKVELQVLRLKKTGEDTAIVTIENGNKKILFTQDIPFTDFPLEEMVIWGCIQDQHRIVLLPSEY